MRLWHQLLLHHLDDKRLLGQHRECCALRGKGWGRTHSTVDYVFNYDIAHLYGYHCLVMREMLSRDFNPDSYWFNRRWRGNCLRYSSIEEIGSYVQYQDELIYKEHDNAYLRECLLNLKSKGAELCNDITIDEWLVKLDLEEPFNKE